MLSARRQLSHELCGRLSAGKAPHPGQPYTHRDWQLANLAPIVTESAVAVRGKTDSDREP